MLRKAGDVGRPKRVLFCNKAHLLFDDVAEKDRAAGAADPL